MRLLFCNGGNGAVSFQFGIAVIYCCNVGSSSEFPSHFQVWARCNQLPEFLENLRKWRSLSFLGHRCTFLWLTDWKPLLSCTAASGCPVTGTPRWLHRPLQITADQQLENEGEDKIKVSFHAVALPSMEKLNTMLWVRPGENGGNSDASFYQWLRSCYWDRNVVLFCD